MPGVLEALELDDGRGFDVLVGEMDRDVDLLELNETVIDSLSVAVADSEELTEVVPTDVDDSVC